MTLLKIYVKILLVEVTRMNRSKLREIAMKVLYQVYILNNTKVKYETCDLIKEQLEVENDFINTIVFGVIKEQKNIEKLANKYLVDWELNQLNKVDKAILSLSIYELLYTDTPHIVSINEAIELSKVYSDPKVTKMINAVLDNIYHHEVLDE